MKNIKKFYILVMVVMIGFVSGSYFVQAESPILDVDDVEVDMPESAFRDVIKMDRVDIKVPTVVEVPMLNQTLAYNNVLVKEIETGRYLGSYLRYTAQPKVPLNIFSEPHKSNTQILSDHRYDSGIDFDVTAEGFGMVTFNIVTNEPVTTSQLNLYLDRYVALPKTIQINALDSSGSWRTIVYAKAMTSTSVNFPEVTTKHFIVSFEYTQPLRITELDFVQKNLQTDAKTFVRFLAQANHTYEIYYNADRSVDVNLSEGGMLQDDRDVLLVNKINYLTNHLYKQSDIDNDSVVDLLDNCVHLFNPDQMDIDNNGRGDMCDDWDKDSILNHKDNCPDHPNRNQLDTDSDGLGDVCDTEESRFTERNPWVPWVGMGTAVVAILILFILVARGTDSVVDSKEENLNG